MSEQHPRFYIPPTVAIEHICDAPELTIDQASVEGISGKTIYVPATEGVGDEVLYAWAWGIARDAGAKLVVDCDRRLVRVFRRSFPGIVAHPYDRRVDQGAASQRSRWLPDGVDCWMKARDFFRYIRSAKTEVARALGDRQRAGWLKADPVRVQQYRDQMLPSAMNVAISWGNPVTSQQRKDNFPPADEWAKTFATDRRITWWNVQHYVDGPLPDGVDAMPDLDVTDDLEGVLALMTACDLVIAPANTPCWLGAAVGKEVWTPRNYPARMGAIGEEDIPGFPMIRPAWRNREGEPAEGAPWGAAMVSIRNELKRRVQEAV